MKKILTVLPMVLLGALCAWVGASLIEVIANNLDPYYTYNTWNVFVVLLNMAK